MKRERERERRNDNKRKKQRVIHKEANVPKLGDNGECSNTNTQILRESK